MPNLAKSGAGKGGSRSAGSESDPRATRVVLVRDSPRSVRAGDQPSRFGARTGFWTAVGAGVIVFLWLSGHVGESIGFATALGLPELSVSRDGGLATGVRIALDAPLRVYEMTRAAPWRLAVAFVLVAIPAAGFAAARPRVPGGPAVAPLGRAFTWLGFVGSLIVSAIVVTWVALPWRLAILAQIPNDPASFRGWLSSLDAIAGFDSFALAAAVLWVVLLFRMPLPRTAIAGAAVAGIMAAFAAWTAFATSGGLAVSVKEPRPTVVVRPAVGGSLLVGTMSGRPVVLRRLDGDAILSTAKDVQIVGRASLAEWIANPRLEPELDPDPALRPQADDQGRP